MGVARLVMISDVFYHTKDFPVGSGGDLIYTVPPRGDPRVAGIDRAIFWLRQNTSETNTVAVIPEGAMINYQARRRNPTPYCVFCLPEVQAFGESNMLAAYQKSPPDYIVVVHRDMKEYGVKFFGQEPGFGHDMMKWVRANYSPVWLFGNEPLVTNKFGLLMLERNARL
jgi:hypothetical protein